MKKAISVLMVAACMLCMVTACEKKDKKGNDTSAAQETETDCTAAELVTTELVTTEPEAEITISEMIDQRIKEEGKIMIYRMCIAESNTPVEITEDLKVNIISYDGEKLTGYDNPDDFLMETRLGDIIHNKVDYSTYNIGAYGGNWKRYDNEFGDEKYVEEEGYVQREITTDDSENNAQLETLYLYSKGQSTVKMNGAYAPPLTAPPAFAGRQSRGGQQGVLPAPYYYSERGNFHDRD